MRENKENKDTEMHEVLLSFRKILQCKPHQKEVHDPKGSKYQRSSQQRTKQGLIQGNKNQQEKQLSFNPKPKGFIDITDTITHEIVLDSSNSKTKVFGCCPCPQSNGRSKESEGSHRTKRSVTHSYITKYVDYSEENISRNTRMLVQMDSDGASSLICHKCGEKLRNLEAVEAHNIFQHSVTELEEDSSRQIIETICGTTSANSENTSSQIDCILKVQNMPRTLASFEEYREMVKIKAEKLQKKHPRCAADGNELLRFHGTMIACSLGKNSCHSLCTLEHCGVCQILRNGFSNKIEFQGALGVETSSTSGKAFDSTEIEMPFTRKSVIVCRVIAGIVEIQEQFVDSSEFDSLAGKISGDSSDAEKLYILNPKALLPCFVVIYKQQTKLESFTLA